MMHYRIRHHKSLISAFSQRSTEKAVCYEAEIVTVFRTLPFEQAKRWTDGKMIVLIEERKEKRLE
jgi:hypothetical protein